MAGRCSDNMNDELFSKLSRDLHEIVNNPQLLRTSTERFFNNLVDELTLGIIFDTHRKAKTRAFDFDDEEDGIEIERGEDIETFSQYNIKKTQDCVCPYCDRAVAATRFATHLERCMVEGKNRQKNAARKATLNNASKQEQENDYRDNGMSEDYDNTDDDADWSPGDKRRKKKKEKNGRKRAKATPKKNAENDYMDTLNLEAETDEQDLSNLRDLLQDRSNCSSPADSTCSSRSGSSGGRKREKSRNKKRRDRASPCSSTSMLD